MKLDNVTALVSSFIRKDNKRIEQSFQILIANEKEGQGKRRLKSLYDEYRRREGQVVIQDLDVALKLLVTAPCRDVSIEDLCLSNTVQKSTDKILTEWQYADKLLQNGLQATNKILLQGPPGNGKTSYAIALAKKIDMPLLCTSSSFILNSFLGESEKNVTTLFQKLPERCVLFFDEFEAVASSRMIAVESGSGKAWNSIVTNFLINMERLRPSVLFIGATNRPEMLDKAIVRRFDTVLQFDNPTKEEKEAFVVAYIQKHNLRQEDFSIMHGSYLDNFTSYSALELVMKMRHKELVLEKIKESGATK